VLTANAYVLRGGDERGATRIAEKLTLAVSRARESALSVWASDPLPDETREQTITRISTEAKTPYPVLQVAIHSALIDKGFTLVHDTTNGQAECHYNLFMHDPAVIEQIEDFISCFGRPESNPTGGR
jgi:hypothetical protein